MGESKWEKQKPPIHLGVLGQSWARTLAKDQLFNCGKKMEWIEVVLFSTSLALTLKAHSALKASDEYSLTKIFVKSGPALELIGADGDIFSGVW